MPLKEAKNESNDSDSFSIDEEEDDSKNDGFILNTIRVDLESCQKMMVHMQSELDNGKKVYEDKIENLTKQIENLTIDLENYKMKYESSCESNEKLRQQNEKLKTKILKFEKLKEENDFANVKYCDLEKELMIKNQEIEQMYELLNKYKQTNEQNVCLFTRLEDNTQELTSTFKQSIDEANKSNENILINSKKLIDYKIQLDSCKKLINELKHENSSNLSLTLSALKKEKEIENEDFQDLVKSYLKEVLNQSMQPFILEYENLKSRMDKLENKEKEDFRPQNKLLLINSKKNLKKLGDNELKENISPRKIFCSPVIGKYKIEDSYFDFS